MSEIQTILTNLEEVVEDAKTHRVGTILVTTRALEKVLQFNRTAIGILRSHERVTQVGFFNTSDAEIKDMHDLRRGLLRELES